MKKLLLCICALSATLLNAQKFGNFEVDNADLKLGTMNFRLNYFDQSWNGFSNKTSTHLEGFPKSTPKKSYETKADFNARGKKVGEFVERINFKSDKSCELIASFSKLEGVVANDISFTTGFPISDSTLAIDGMIVDLEKSKNMQKIVSANSVTVSSPDGVLKISGKFDVLVQDGRKFGSRDFSLRFFPEGKTNPLKWYFSISFEKTKGLPVSLGGTKSLDIPELPNGWLKLGGIEFSFSNPAGSGIIVPEGKEVSLNLKNTRKYLYILGGFDTRSALTPNDCLELEFKFADGKTESVKIEPQNSGSIRSLKTAENGNTVWASKVGAKSYNICASKIEIERENPVSVKIKNTSKADFKIAAASFCPVDVPVQRLKGAFLTQSKDYAPFETSRTIVKSSALDFSWILDAPAGKYGFVQARGAEIFFENRPDKPVRFYGNNLCFNANYPDKENADKLADNFAACGYNILRIHHYDNNLIDKSSKDRLNFDADMLDRLDYLVYAMKKRGIYITTDLYVSRVLADDAVESNIGWNKSMTANKAAFYVSKKAVDNWRKFSEKLLTHVNKYTGVAWKDEPALVSISLVNENTIYGVYRAMRPHFDSLFEKWLKDNPAPKYANSDYLRTKFLAKMYDKFFAEQKAFLRSLGVRAMLTDQNFQNGYALAYNGKNYDIFDTHTYFGHPHFFEKPWQLPAKMRTDSAISAYGGCINKTALQIAGKPFAITEWNYVNNNDHSAEGAFLIGAYGALHKWDMLCRFAYSHLSMDFSKPAGIVGYFDSMTNPTAALSDRAAVLFFLRGDVKAADFSIPLLLPENYFDKADKSKHHGLWENSLLLTRTGLYAATEIVLNPTAAGFKIPQNAPFAIAAESDVIAKNKFSKPVVDDTSENFARLQKLTGGKMDFENETYESSTSEMILNKKNETWKLVTANSEAFIGPKGESFKGDFVDIRNSYSWSSTLVASIDKNALKDSARILILHLSDVKNTNMRFDDTEMKILRDNGRLPLLVRKSESVVRFKDAREGWRMYALKSDGSRVTEIKIERNDGIASAKLSTVSAKGVAVFAYELVYTAPL